MTSQPFISQPQFNYLQVPPSSYIVMNIHQLQGGTSKNPPSHNTQSNVYANYIGGNYLQGGTPQVLQFSNVQYQQQHIAPQQNVAMNSEPPQYKKQPCSQQHVPIC